MTSAEARFNKSLHPRKPEGSLGRTAQDVHLDSHTAPELWRSGQWALHYIPNPSELEEKPLRIRRDLMPRGIVCLSSRGRLPNRLALLQQGFFQLINLWSGWERKKKSTFESCKNMSVKAVLLCLAACVCDMSVAGQCVTSVYYILSQPFSALYLWRGNQNGCTLMRAAGKQNGTFEANLQKNHTEFADGSICLLSVFRPTCILILTQWQFHRLWDKGTNLLVTACMGLI